MFHVKHIRYFFTVENNLKINIVSRETFFINLGILFRIYLIKTAQHRYKFYKKLMVNRKQM